ncbi:MAG: hypothetical protein LBP19_05295 [Treponema sp.]|jgi:hypothetical protein|nr:hypothetical protein [Treponema sp.]
MTGCGCVDLSTEQCHALNDTQEQVCMGGMPTEVILRNEPDIERDNLGAIKKRTYRNERRFTFHAVVERQQNAGKLEKLGLRETCDSTATYAIAEWIDAGIIQLDRLGESFKAIDIIRSTVLFDGTEWKIKDKGLSGRLGGIPLFITLGLEEN